MSVSDCGARATTPAAQHTQSVVISSKHPIPAGYKYDGSSGLDYARDETFGSSYVISFYGDKASTINNVIITKNRIKWKEKAPDIFMPWWSTSGQ